MKPERFKRTKSVVASSAIALVVAALVMGISSLVDGPRSASLQRPGFKLTSNPSSFTITSTFYKTPSGPYPASTCSGSGTLVPGVTLCVVFTITNSLDVPISVTGITSALDPSFPTPPAMCMGSYLTLPTFSGSFGVPASGSANGPGVPITLNDSTTVDQTPCEGFKYHFTYSGTAQYTDSTTTTLTSSPNPSTSGQSVTFKATVTAGNPTIDSSLPSGTVNFYKCTSATVCPNTGTPFGTGTIGAGGVATVSASTLPVGTTYVDAVNPASGTDFLGSTSGVVAQVVGSSLIGTTTALTSTPDPSGVGNPVTLTATVTKTSGTGTPTGTVTFHLGSPTGTVVGTGTLNSGGVATASTSLLPVGADNLYAVYAGDAHFSGSTSPVRVQTVIGLPAKCTSTYPNFFYGNPAFPIINGTNGNDFVYAMGGGYWINGFNGNDCLWAGDGDNSITDGNGNDVVIGGNDENYVAVGNGSDSVSVGNGSNTVSVGNGTDTVVVGNGSHNTVVVGNGSDTVTVGTGTYNAVTLGSGTDTVTLTSPGTALSTIHDTINGGAGNETIYLGSGSYNTYNGVKGKTNTCHLPTPPSSWHGTPATYYHDTITNCTVVTP